MDRTLAWPACVNVRDLGGIRSATGFTRWRSVVRADNLDRLTDEGLRAIRDYGIRSVIDLRAEWEIARFPYPFGPSDLPDATLVNVPLISDANWRAVANNEGGEHPYVLIARLSASNIVAAIRAVMTASDAVVVHCHEGRERTGIIAAVLLELGGANDEDIATDWIMSQPDRLTASDIVPVLRYMRTTHGSVAQFLVANGLSLSELDAARSRLRE